MKKANIKIAGYNHFENKQKGAIFVAEDLAMIATAILEKQGYIPKKIEIVVLDADEEFQEMEITPVEE
jgi:hypothetical protein